MSTAALTETWVNAETALGIADDSTAIVIARQGDSRYHFGTEASARADGGDVLIEGKEMKFRAAAGDQLWMRSHGPNSVISSQPSA